VHVPYDLVCLSHLRWDFVYQRPQHLLTRFARDRRVFFVEEPVLDAATPALELLERQNGVVVVKPHMPAGLEAAAVERTQRELLDALFAQQAIERYVLWYYTPRARLFSRHLKPLATVYDCMDELSGFQNAPADMVQHETDLLRHADLVLTGGRSLYEAKRGRHPNVHACPSSVDVAHFAQARQPLAEPGDQVTIPHPRLGFFGVLDERLDLDLVAGVAAMRPDWQLVMVGPVVKIDPATLPSAANIHYLGAKPYDVLPAYLAGWDAALLPFARNAATRFISPTKTLEYLAAGKPVVSTSIHDVVHPYGESGLAGIADTAPAFVAAVEAGMREDGAARLRRCDAFLSHTSWENTWQRMARLTDEAVAVRQTVRTIGTTQPAAGESHTFAGWRAGRSKASARTAR